MSNLLNKLPISGFRKIEKNSERIERFSEQTFDNKTLTIEVRLMDEEKIFLVVLGLSIIGYTSDASVAFQYLNNASIYTGDEIYNAARKGMKRIPRVYSRRHISPDRQWSTGVSYTEQRAYAWLRRP